MSNSEENLYGNLGESQEIQIENLEDYYSRLILKCNELKLLKFHSKNFFEEKIPNVRWAKPEIEEGVDNFLNIARSETDSLLIYVKKISKEDIREIGEELIEKEDELSYLEEPDDIDGIKEKRFEINNLERVREIYTNHLGKIGLLTYGWIKYGVLYSNRVSTSWYDYAIGIYYSDYNEESQGINPENEVRTNLKKFKEMPLEDMVTLLCSFLEDKYTGYKMTSGQTREIKMNFLFTYFSLREYNLKDQKRIRKLDDAFAKAIQVNVNKEVEGSAELVDSLVTQFKKNGTTPSKITKSTLNAYLVQNGKILSEAAKEIIFEKVKGKMN